MSASATKDVALVVLAAAAFVLSFSVWLLIWRRGFHRFHAAFGKASVEFDAVERVATQVEELAAQLQPNGGKSLRDAVNRIESTVSVIAERVTALEEAATTPKEH